MADCVGFVYVVKQSIEGYEGAWLRVDVCRDLSSFHLFALGFTPLSSVEV